MESITYRRWSANALEKEGIGAQAVHFFDSRLHVTRVAVVPQKVARIKKKKWKRKSQARWPFALSPRVCYAFRRAGSATRSLFWATYTYTLLPYIATESAARERNSHSSAIYARIRQPPTERTRATCEENSWEASKNAATFFCPGQDGMFLVFLQIRALIEAKVGGAMQMNFMSRSPFADDLLYSGEWSTSSKMFELRCAILYNIFCHSRIVKNF